MAKTPPLVADEQEGSRTSHVAQETLAGERTSACANRAIVLHLDGWAAASEEISEDNLLWRQYVLLVDLYRYYIDLIWKVSIWFYTATGVSLAYFFTHFDSGNHSYLPLLLLFLGAMGIGVSRIFSRVIHYVKQMENWLEYIAVSLRLPGRPHVEFIRWFCQFVSGTLLLLAASCFGFYGYLQT